MTRARRLRRNARVHPGTDARHRRQAATARTRCTRHTAAPHPPATLTAADTQPGTPVLGPRPRRRADNPVCAAPAGQPAPGSTQRHGRKRTWPARTARQTGDPA